MTESYRDKLNEIDHKCLDEDLKFYDLRSLFESVAPKLSAEDKEEIKKVIQNTNDAETIAAVLQAKAMDDKNESLEESVSSEVIYDYLDELGSYIDYDEKIQELMDEFNLDKETAESYVWDWSSGLHKLYDDNEELEEKLIPAPQEVVDELINILNKYGFVLDDSFKVNPGKTFMGDTHMQVINPESLVDMSDEIDIQDQLSKYITQDLIDEIHDLDQKSDCPITWNFGPNKNGQVTGGLDIMKQYVAESYKDVYYVIMDKHGNQLSRPTKDDSELWDRVESRDPKGTRGLKVVVYTGKVDEKLDEASYGGVYDIEDDMFFTRDDLNEFLNVLIDKLDNYFGYSFDVYDAYLSDPTHFYIELIDENHDINMEYVFEIDMRRIRKPSDLQKYIPETFKHFVQKYQNEYDQWNFDESLKEDYIWEITYGKGRPGGNMEHVKFPEYKDAFEYAANNDHGWGFDIKNLSLEKSNESLKESEDSYFDYDEAVKYIESKGISADPTTYVGEYVCDMLDDFASDDETYSKEDLDSIINDVQQLMEETDSEAPFNIIIDGQKLEDITAEDIKWAKEDIENANIDVDDVYEYHVNEDADYFIITFKDGTKKAWYIHSGMYIPDKDFIDESLKEDTVKQNGKWVNKGKEGTHGKFNTKKAADAQRKAMFANGYKESLTEKQVTDKGQLLDSGYCTRDEWPEVKKNQIKKYSDKYDDVRCYQVPSDTKGLRMWVTYYIPDKKDNLTESYSVGYVKGHPYNQDMIYSVLVNPAQKNGKGERYSIVTLHLVCGKDYVDSTAYDGQAWVDAKQFVDDVQLEQIVWYPDDESLADALEANDYIECNRPHFIWHYDEEKDDWYRNTYTESLEEDITAKQQNSPKRYVYEICDRLGWNPPTFIDAVAGGYRLRYREDSKEEAQETIDAVQRVASEMGIKVKRPAVKPTNQLAPNDDWVEYDGPTKEDSFGRTTPDWDSDEYKIWKEANYHPTYYSYIVIPRYEQEDESLEEDYQQDKDEWGEPYSYDEVERELKSITNNWTDKEGTIRCYWEQEKNYGLQILKKYYKYVETSDGRTGKGEDMSWVLAYSKPKEIFDESLNESVTSQLQDKIIDCLDWFILMEMEFPKGKFLADSWEDVKDGIQMGIDPEFEIAEGIVEYLKPIITFNKRYNKEVEEEGVFQDEIEMYQSLVRAMNNYLAKNGYEERIEE